MDPEVCRVDLVAAAVATPSPPRDRRILVSLGVPLPATGTAEVVVGLSLNDDGHGQDHYRLSPGPSDTVFGFSYSRGGRAAGGVPEPWRRHHRDLGHDGPRTGPPHRRRPDSSRARDARRHRRHLTGRASSGGRHSQCPHPALERHRLRPSSSVAANPDGADAADRTGCLQPGRSVDRRRH